MTVYGVILNTTKGKMMTETKFTPAPWKTGQVSWDEETKDVRYTLHGVKEAKAADCHLIAAAPELYAALEYLALPPFGDDDPDYGIKTREYALQALAKARGEHE